MTGYMLNSEARGLLDALPVGVLVSRLPDGEVVFANRRACETLGLEPAEATDLQTTAFYRRPEDREIAVQTLVRHGQVDDAEFEMRGPAGDIIWVRISVGMLEREGDGIAIATIRDVTGVHAAQRHLRTACRMEAFRRIAGGLAHEVNNALVPILTFGELAMDDVDTDSTAHAHLKRVLEAANRCADIVGRVMEFSSAPSGARATVDLRRIVARAGELVGLVAPRRVGVNVELPDEPVWVGVDPAMLEEAAFAVALDGADAYGEDSGVVSLVLSIDDVDASSARDMGLAPGGHACLRIHDTGEGIDNAAFERVLHPNVEDRDAPLERGPGLSLARRAVGTHDGTVRVDDEPDGGTCVGIWLPLAPAAPSDADAGAGDE